MNLSLAFSVDAGAEKKRKEKKRKEKKRKEKNRKEQQCDDERCAGDKRGTGGRKGKGRGGGGGAEKIKCERRIMSVCIMRVFSERGKERAHVCLCVCV